MSAVEAKREAIMQLRAKQTHQRAYIDDATIVAQSKLFGILSGN
jgi:hypothetical protein